MVPVFEGKNRLYLREGHYRPLPRKEGGILQKLHLARLGLSRVLRRTPGIPLTLKNDIAVFVQAFREFDEDHSGAINKYELHKAFTHMGLGYSGAEVDEVNRRFVIDTPVDRRRGQERIRRDRVRRVPLRTFVSSMTLQIMRVIYPQKYKEYSRQFLVNSDSLLTSRNPPSNSPSSLPVTSRSSPSLSSDRVENSS